MVAFRGQGPARPDFVSMLYPGFNPGYTTTFLRNINRLLRIVGICRCVLPSVTRLKFLMFTLALYLRRRQVTVKSDSLPTHTTSSYLLKRTSAVSCPVARKLASQLVQLSVAVSFSGHNGSFRRRKSPPD